MRKAGFHGHLKNDANPGIFLERKNRHQAAAFPLLAAPLWCRPLSPSHGDSLPHDHHADSLRLACLRAGHGAIP